MRYILDASLIFIGKVMLGEMVQQVQVHTGARCDSLSLVSRAFLWHRSAILLLLLSELCSFQGW